MKKLYLKIILTFCCFFVSFGHDLLAQNFLPYTDALTLKTQLGQADFGDIVYLSGNGPINLDDIPYNEFPLIVKSGVILTGNYDLLGITGNQNDVVFTSGYRSSYSAFTSGGARSEMFVFSVVQGTTAFPTIIKNIRLRGAMWTLQDYNQQDMMCGGIIVQNLGSFVSPTSTDLVRIYNCEISGFSYSGIFCEGGTTDITVDHCFIHHVKGTGGDEGVPKGYGIWIQGAHTQGIGMPTENNMLNNIYDNCKAAIDGQGYPSSWNIINCSFTQFFNSEDINRHNDNNFYFDFTNPTNKYGYPHGCTAGNSCEFYIENNNNPLSVEQTDCSSSPLGFEIYDIGGANTTIESCIFHKEHIFDEGTPGSGIGSSSSNINLTYPNRDALMGGNSNNKITIANNTIASNSIPAGMTYQYNLGGWARISDNYIEYCPWIGDNNIDWNSNVNTLGHVTGTTVSTNCPQPPEVEVNLLDGSSLALPTTSVGGTSYIDLTTNPTGDFKIKVESGTNVSSDLAYIIRPNPNSKSNSCGNTSAGNSYFDDEEVLNSTGVPVTKDYSYKDNLANPLPGLYGVDVLAVARDNSITPKWNTNNSSVWNHIPLIVKPTGSNSKLIFNIKDSYQEQYNPGLSSTPFPDTHVLKQVELNGFPIWSEDIACGGFDWERIEIDLNDPLVFQYMNGGTNTFSASIVIENGFNVSNDLVKGVAVWIDDVYINGYNSVDGENLITDGSIESCETLGTTPNSLTCSWWKENISYFECNIPIAPPNEEKIYFYPDGQPLSPNDITYHKSDAFRTTAERKSGNYSLVLNLPALADACIGDYLTSNSIGQPLITVSTNFEYKKDCIVYLNDLAATFGTITGADYNVNQSFTLTGDMIIDNCNLSIEPNVTITVPKDWKLTITNSSLLTPCWGMWKGIVLETPDYNDVPEFEINSSSKIEYAINAIYAKNGAQLTIDNAFFDHNYIDLHLRGNSHAVYPAIINNSNFTCNGCLTGNPLKGPYFGQRTFAHISLFRVEFGIKIGDNSATGSPNNFDCATFGILSERSNSEIVNNEFTNFTTTLQERSTDGLAIYTFHRKTLADHGLPSFTTTVGGTGTNDPNSFIATLTDEMHGGIWSEGVNLDIKGNNLDFVQQGIRFLSSFREDFNVHSNYIRNSQTGIYGFSYGSNTYISDNVISVKPIANNGYAAIEIQGAYSESGGISIYDNPDITTEGYYGIHLHGTYSRVMNNDVNMNHALGSLSQDVFGVKIENSPGPNVDCNRVFGNSTSGFDFKKAISLSYCNEGTIESNSTNNTHIGLEFLATCDNSTIQGNAICNHQYGLVVGEEDMTPGVIGSQKLNSVNETRGNKYQGFISAGNIPTGNFINGFATFLANSPLPVFWTETNIINGNSSDKYYTPLTNGSAGVPAIQPQPPGINNGIYTPLANCNILFVACEDPRRCHDTPRDRAESIVQSSEQSGTSEETVLWQQKKDLYEEIRENNTLLATSTILSDFVSDSEQSAMGYLSEVDETVQTLITDTVEIDTNLVAQTITDAQIFNNNVLPDNAMEENEKTINNIYLNTIAVGNYDFTEAQKEIVSQISHQCPYTGGKYVFIARSIFSYWQPNYHFDDKSFCNSTSRFAKPHMNLNNANTSNTAILYPNPNKGIFTLECDLSIYPNATVLIKDLTGKTLIAIELNSKNLIHDFDTKELNNGIYILTVKSETEVIANKRLNIIK